MEKKKVLQMKDTQKNIGTNTLKRTSEEIDWEDQLTLEISHIRAIFLAILIISENDDLEEPFDSALDHLSRDGIERINRILGQVEGREQIIALKRVARTEQR